jgi:hypothetical protein
MVDVAAVRGDLAGVHVLLEEVEDPRQLHLVAILRSVSPASERPQGAA